MLNNPSIRVQFLKTIGALGQEKPIQELLTSIRADSTTAEIISLQSYPHLTNLEYLTYETFVAPDILKTVRQSSLDGVDAMVIACFFDPVLDAAREISGDMIVVGPCQASVQLAANLANRFSVIIGQEKWARHVHHLIRRYGYSEYLASTRSIDVSVPDLQADCNYTRSQIIKAGRKAIEEDKAEALILGCTCTYGLFEDIQDELGVPIIDPTYASFKMAEFLASTKKRFGWSHSKKWSCEPPSEADLDEFKLFDIKPSIKSITKIS